MATNKSRIIIHPVGHEEKIISFTGECERTDGQSILMANTEKIKSLMKAGQIEFDEYEKVR